MNPKTKKHLMTAAITGMMSAAFVLSTDSVAGSSKKSTAGKYKCEGGNTCKGEGKCDTKTHPCAGHNKCAGQGWIYTKDEAACKAAKAAVDAKKKKG